MAYVYSGVAQETYNYNDVSMHNEKFFYSQLTIENQGFPFFITVYGGNGRLYYNLYAIVKTITDTVKYTYNNYGTNENGDIIRGPFTGEEELANYDEELFDKPIKQRPLFGESGSTGNSDNDYNALFSTTIPVFNNNDKVSINNYINNGDTSGAIKKLNADWTLGIDGTKSPLYKLKWNCKSISGSDIVFGVHWMLYCGLLVPSIPGGQ